MTPERFGELMDEQTTAIVRAVDKARTPAEEFIKSVEHILAGREFQLQSYGVTSNTYSESETITLTLADKRAVTIAVANSKY